MGKVERIVIYTLLALLAVAAFTDLGSTQAKDTPGEATFRKVTIVDEEGRARIVLGEMKGRNEEFGIGILDETARHGPN